MVTNQSSQQEKERVRHPKFGHGTIEFDKGATVIVRFEHGLEECEVSSLTRLRSFADSILLGQPDSPLPVVTKALAYSITSINDSWGVFSRSRIALLPHQLWVCRKVLSEWPARWLIADDVGLGKTIEAGLILWPLISKGLIRRLLIICPASLVEQWQFRLRTMFDIKLAKYASSADSEKTDFWSTHNYVAASLETLRLDRNERHKRLFEADPWDLLVIDEAHHISADEQSGPTLGFKFVQRLVEEQKVNAMTLFTGTPHRGKNFAFLSLMSLLKPDTFNPKAPLSTQLPMLRQSMIRNNKQNVTDLKGNRLFKPPIVTSETYSYSKEEGEFYDMLTEFILTGKAYASTLGAADQRLVMLVLIAMQKLASSSVAAIRRALTGRLERLTGQKQKLEKAKARIDELKNLSSDYDSLESAGRADELSQLEETMVTLSTGVLLMEDEEEKLRELLKASEGVTRETKIDKILDILNTQFQDRSVLLFTEYKATQSLLMSELIRKFGDKCVTFINGDERAEDVVDSQGNKKTLFQTKEQAADAFNDGGVRFLISTEAGGEGIDLQSRCHSLVHVDLPWNPMRLHQRVGRLNRYGQTKQVEVLTLRNPDTVESRIWEKLNEKIENITLAFGHVMDEPEDLLQMVLGMTSPALFRELFGEADVSSDSLSNWFNQKTATFGGRDVIETVKELVGNCERFDFQSVGKDLPPVDLPDLRPFFEGILIQNRRRPRVTEDGSLSFKTPDTWTKEFGVQNNYEGMVFDRSAKGKNALVRVLGVGHKLFDQAIKQALLEPAFIASINPDLLKEYLLIARITDRVTTGSGTVRAVLVGATLTNASASWNLLRDWEVLKQVNTFVGSVALSKRQYLPLDSPSQLLVHCEAALSFIENQLPGFNLGFRVPQVEPLCFLCPGSPQGTDDKFHGSEDDSIDD